MAEFDLDAAMAADPGIPGVKIEREYLFRAFDIGAIGTGEMIMNVEWVFMVLIVLEFGLGFSLAALVLAVAVMAGMYYLYRELITAVPEPGWMQSYARESGLFSIGSSMFIMYVVVFTAFEWGEMHILTSLFHGLVPAVPSWLWPPIMILPMLVINLLGHQITGKIQTIMVAAVLACDAGFAIGLGFVIKSKVLAANWHPPVGSHFGFHDFMLAASFWLAIYVGYEISIVVLDEWKDVNRGVRIGLPFALIGVLVTYLIMLFAIVGTTPIATAANYAIPHVGAVHAHFPYWAYIVILGFALIASHTSINIYFMACGKQIAAYSMQGALPRVFSRYSSRSAVPWVAILFLTAATLVGSYLTTNNFILAAMSTFATNYYMVIPIFYLLMRRNKNLPRPIKARFGVPVAIFVSAACAIMFYYTALSNLGAFAFWVGLVVAIALYDHFVVPRTKRGAMYRQELLRKRGSEMAMTTAE